MKKLNAKQLQTLPKNKYHDGNGLYISISKPGRGKWSFRYTINKKSREMGLGSYPDVSLSIKLRFDNNTIRGIIDAIPSTLSIADIKINKVKKRRFFFHF